MKKRSNVCAEKGAVRPGPVLALTVVSGALGLAYEVLWARVLGLSAGHGLAASSTVAATFMAGLALGSLLAEAPRLRRLPPLTFYGALEVGIALYALAFPWLLGLADPLAGAAYRVAGASPACSLALNLGWAGALLLVPTTLMGATVPALVRIGLARTPGDARLAWIYGANCLGGALGALAVTFTLLPALGHAATGLVLAATGAALGAVAIVSGRCVDAAPQTVEHPRTVSGEALLVTAIVGAVGMALEVAWTRALILFVGSSTYAFSLILAAFIGGLSLGSHLAALLFCRVTEVRRLVGTLLVVVGVAGLASLAYIGQIPIWASTALGDSANRFGWLCAVELALVSLVTLPATVALGMLLPLSARLKGRIAGLGHYYGANTAGAVLGTLAATFVTIPRSGLSGTIGACSLVPMVLGGFLIPRSANRMALAVGLAAVGLVTLHRLPPWDTVLLNSGPFVTATSFQKQSQQQRVGIEDVVRRAGKILFHKEGPQTTVAVRESEGHLRTLLVNGKPDASTLLDMKTQRLVAHLPLALSPDARDVLVVGLGSGVTAGAVLRHPVRSATVVELSPEVVEASRFFIPESGAPLDDPRTRLVIGDARTHIFRSTDSYDLLISEPTNPWIAGVSSLFTVEFFERCRARLRPRGMMAQWLQAYSLSAADFASVVATFRKVFPDASLWQAVSSADYILIGSTGQRPISVADARRAFSRDAVRREAADVDVRDEVDLLAHFLAGPGGLARLAGGARLQVDDRLDLEFTTPQHLMRDATDDLMKRLAAVAEPVDAYLAEGSSPRLLTELAVRRERYHAYDLLREGELPRASACIARIEEACIKERLSRLFLKGFYLAAVNLMQEAGNLDAARSVLEGVLARHPLDAELRGTLGMVLCRQGDISGSGRVFRRILELDPAAPEGHRGLAVLAEARGDLAAALEHYRAVRKARPYDPVIASAVVRVLMIMDRRDEAHREFATALEADPALSFARIVEPLQGGTPVVLQ